MKFSGRKSENVENQSGKGSRGPIPAFGTTRKSKESQIRPSSKLVDKRSISKQHDPETSARNYHNNELKFDNLDPSQSETRTIKIGGRLQRFNTQVTPGKWESVSTSSVGQQAAGSGEKSKKSFEKNLKIMGQKSKDPLKNRETQMSSALAKYKADKRINKFDKSPPRGKVGVDY